jgi:hypothetical protein
VLRRGDDQVSVGTGHADFRFHHLGQAADRSHEGECGSSRGDRGPEDRLYPQKNFRKEDKVKAVLQERGDHPGLVWVFSALEPCTTYQPWHHKVTHRSYLRYDDGKCLHYYFYFIDEELGLCYVRGVRFDYSSMATATTGWQDN